MSSVTNYPLSCHFVWHPFDAEFCDPLLDEIRKIFARDINKPFSRGINIPIFFYSSSNGSIVPSNYPHEAAEKNLVFLFTSGKTLISKVWGDYFEALGNSENLTVIPIAIDQHGLKHKQKNLVTKNAIRLYESKCMSNSIISIGHEIYRYGFQDIDKNIEGNHYSLKVFLSHAKADKVAVNIATKLYALIDTTNLNRFFDAHDISPGFIFGNEIQKHIENATLVCIHSDTYSSRYWCQREIIHAKKNLRPIIAVCCLEDQEDRVLPAASNIPCLHIPHEEEIKDETLYRILQSSMLETLRCLHSMSLLAFYKTLQWIPNDCEIFPRPPEIRQIMRLKNSGKANKVCYPEPSLYSEEQDWLIELGIDAFTPLTFDADQNLLDDLNVGISISDIDIHDFSEFHQHSNQLMRLSQDISRHLLARKAYVCYGGDLRDDGFTQFILDEAVALNNRLMSNDIRVFNHLAWPVYLPKDVNTEWRLKYSDVIETIEHLPPQDILDSIDVEICLKPTTYENLYIWSRCLTKMRENMILTNNARIFAGGRLTGYKGCMPGVLEELIISFKKEIPIYLLGGFGGITREICGIIANKQPSIKLTKEWQLQNNSGYAAIQDIADKYGTAIDYQYITQTIKEYNIDDLVRNSGLIKGDYLRLIESPFADECCHLILKGLSNVVATNKNHTPGNI